MSQIMISKFKHYTGHQYDRANLTQNHETTDVVISSIKYLNLSYKVSLFVTFQHWCYRKCNSLCIIILQTFPKCSLNSAHYYVETKIEDW